MTFLFSFTGVASIPFITRLQQYSEFVRYCFLAPCAGIHEGKLISWQLCPAEQISYTGLLILVVALISAALNRREKLCRISALWIAYSFLILCVIGWGTAENGLILYSLYFSWAFYVLIFMLAAKLDDLSGIRLFVPALLVAGIYVFVHASIPAIGEVISFAAKYYPCGR